jgi:hypothetical protein
LKKGNVISEAGLPGAMIQGPQCKLGTHHAHPFGGISIASFLSASASFFFPMGSIFCAVSEENNLDRKVIVVA